jgi:hypothetical protein
MISPLESISSCSNKYTGYSGENRRVTHPSVWTVANGFMVIPESFGHLANGLLPFSPILSDALLAVSLAAG